VTRTGTAHGICLWFEAQLLEGITYSSGPGSSKTIYGQVFLPWLEAVPVQEGQRICISLQANLVGEEYVWRWETKMNRPGDAPLQFRQSTFQGANLTPQALRRRAADFVPSLSEDGLADRWLLQAMDGNTSLQQMAQAAAERFPSLFPRWEDALHRAAELARQFSR
jgi:protein arginine N-methyltransferase 1